MDGYQVDQAPFCTDPDGSVVAFKGHSIKRENRPVTVISHELTHITYKAQLPAVLDDVLNISLEQAHGEEQRGLKVLEIRVDVSNAPEKYVVYHIMDTARVGQDGGHEASAETLLLEYMQKTAVKLMAAAEIAKKSDDQTGKGVSKHYRIDDYPFYVSEDGSVCLFGTFNTIFSLRVIPNTQDFLALITPYKRFKIDLLQFLKNHHLFNIIDQF